MVDSNKKSISSQLFSFAKDSYLDRTARPVYSLAYLLGFIVLYEIGTVLISSEALSSSLDSSQVRVVSFAWIQSILDEYLNFPLRVTWLATPFVVIIILVAMQITSRTPWRVRLADFIPMTVESTLLAVPLIILSMTINRSPAMQQATVYLLKTVEGYTPTLAMQIVSGIGAGIYEELVFRLILISLLMLLFQDFIGISHKNSVILSVAISAILFSAHHHIFYINGMFTKGEDFYLSIFLFRALAGVYFALIFAVRGFGIVVACHAFYDIIAAVLNYIIISNQPA